MAPNFGEDWRDALLKASGFSEDDMKSAAEEAARDSHNVTKEKAVQKKKLNIFVEKKGRGGKTVTIVTGFECDDEELKEIASALKNQMGCGGSSRDGEILLQGSRRDETARRLIEMGYRI